MDKKMYNYIYPPRPKLFVRENLNALNLNEYCAQKKLNDTRNLIIYTPDKGIELFTRHRTPHLAYRPKKDTIEQFMALPFDKSKQQIFDSLLLHNKNPTVRDTWVLMDWLVIDGIYALGTSFFYRDVRLDGLGVKQIEQQTGMKLAWQISPNIWKAMSYDAEVAEQVLQTYEPEWEKNQMVEGIVLKHLKRPLGMHFSKPDCDWQFKIRFKKEGIYDY